MSDILCHFLVPNSFNPPFRHFPANYVSVIFPGTTTIPLALLNILQIHRKTRVLLWKLRNLKHLFSQNTFGGYFFTLNKVTLNTEQSNLHFGIGSEKKRKCKNQSIPSHSALFSISFYQNQPTLAKSNPLLLIPNQNQSKPTYLFSLRSSIFH